MKFSKELNFENFRSINHKVGSVLILEKKKTLFLERKFT